MSGKAIALADCNGTGNSLVLTDEKTPGPCAQWRLEPLNDGSFRLVNRSSSKVLEVAGCSTTSGAKLQQGNWSNNSCERFRVVLP